LRISMKLWLRTHRFTMVVADPFAVTDGPD